MEPLQNLLQIYNDKEKVLLYYLPNQTTKFLDNHEYIQDPETLFLNDRIVFVSKSNGKIFKKGIIIKITDSRIMIKESRNNLSIEKDNYYLFRYIRKNKSKKINRKYYEELLKSLG